MANENRRFKREAFINKIYISRLKNFCPSRAYYIYIWHFICYLRTELFGSNTEVVLVVFTLNYGSMSFKFTRALFSHHLVHEQVVKYFSCTSWLHFRKEVKTSVQWSRGSLRMTVDISLKMTCTVQKSNPVHSNYNLTFYLLIESQIS
jgi:hypothetical protein